MAENKTKIRADTHEQKKTETQSNNRKKPKNNFINSKNHKQQFCYMYSNC